MPSPDTLLDTPLTWTDVEKGIQKTLNTAAKFGNNRKADNLGHMKGFFSRIALISPDWINCAEEDRLPDQLVVKIPTTLAIADLLNIDGFLDGKEIEENGNSQMKNEEIVRMMHNLEVQMYSIIARENNPSLPVTRMYASQALTEKNLGYLVFDYVQNAYSVPLLETIPFEDIVPVVDAAAVFSAMGERMSEEEREATAGKDFLEKSIKHYFPNHTFETMRKDLNEILGETNKETIDTSMKTFNLICGTSGVLENYSKVPEFLGHRPVLMHSDLWPGNMIFEKNEKDRLDFKALIDFQTVSLSSPGFDVAAIAITCLSPEDRREHKDELIERYYEKFVENLKGAAVPYTLKQLHDSYELMIPAGVIITMPFALSLVKDKEEFIIEAARKKIVEMLKNVNEIQESNLKKFPEFFKVV